MKSVKFIMVAYFLSVFCATGASPTFGDLAVLMAKGYFKDQVPQNARLEQCVRFLNRQGVVFSIFDVVDPGKTVTKEDVARVVGQSSLLFSGEAEVVNGGIKKPLGAETWVDYCLLNDIDFLPVWVRLLKCTEEEPLPEVRMFFQEVTRAAKQEGLQ